MDKHIEHINNLVKTFWNAGDLDPRKMFSLIVSKFAVLKYINENHLGEYEKAKYEKILEKIDEVEKEYYRDLPEMPEWLKKWLKETPLTIKNAETLLKVYIKIMKNKVLIKPHLQIIEQQLLGRYE